MACKETTWLLSLILMLLCIMVSADTPESTILVKFKASLYNASALRDWNESSDPCSDGNGWTGVKCFEGKVWTLQLENMGLAGQIDIESLKELQMLRTISIMGNSFGGPMPAFKRLAALKSLYLSNNRFSGELPDDAFAHMNWLKKVYLAQNEFTGKIPKSLAKLPKLLEVLLENNNFEGKIPNFPQNELQKVNMSNNALEGRIPASLSKMDRSSFIGNEDLCGLPLVPCKESEKPSILIIALVVGGVVVLAAIILAVFLIRRQKGKASKLGQPSSAKAHKEAAVYEAEHKEVGSTGVYKKGEQGQLYFVRNDRERFELQDLLRASAEVLGSGSFGSSYKAVLLSGPAMVVKRFKQMNRLGSGDFHEHMRRLGRLSHPNLLSLVALYYKKEEKLLVSDFVPNGSLASHLHSKRAPGQPGLDWPIRLKIIQKVAHALAYLYKELSDLTLPHGHLKSSNVLLDDKFEPVLSDYALVPAINREHAQQIMVAYKSPEFMQYDRTTRKTDVWSLGILILEMLTGKFPANYLKQGKGANSDLLSWVNSVVREEWTGEVFDKDMKGTRNGEGEMLKLLKIGMSCCEWNLEKRWDLKEAVKRIEELKERDSDEDNSSYASEGDIYSSRAMTDDDFSFSVNN
ncbi:probable LRR receptor-like serine/threonine-protein kinase At4g31250 [Vitis riparia]|uniref:probable LRR receptor-like serine/threonine-protein kinase At4g31250 n=1 Tax=Vitis riparia TaxID=96939 RepID=UPI00155AC7EE|nr:probable LRR receptor-like serine/threonine-protein kinase At4g31250 [Vitis riparia]